MGYLITHVLSYFIRNYLLSFPKIHVFNLDPIITELFVLNALIGSVAYILTGFIYDKDNDPSFLGSIFYFIEYFIILILIWIAVPIVRLFGISDIYSIIIPIFLMLSINLKIAEII